MNQLKIINEQWENLKEKEKLLKKKKIKYKTNGKSITLQNLIDIYSYIHFNETTATTTKLQNSLCKNKFS